MLHLLFFLTSSYASQAKIAVMPIEADWSRTLASSLAGVAPETDCKQFSCYKTVATGLGASQYVAGTVVRYDKRIYLALRLHDVATYSPVAKASIDWAEHESADAHLKAAALALLRDYSAPRTGDAMSTFTLDRSPAPSPWHDVGLALTVSGVAGIVTGAVLFGIAQASVPALRESVAAYNAQPVRNQADFDSLRAREHGISGLLISGYALMGASLPALVIGAVALARTPGS